MLTLNVTDAAPETVKALAARITDKNVELGSIASACELADAITAVLRVCATVKCKCIIHTATGDESWIAAGRYGASWSRVSVFPSQGDDVYDAERIRTAAPDGPPPYVILHANIGGEVAGETVAEWAARIRYSRVTGLSIG